MPALIYFDNAATSWPKPAAVSAALGDYFGPAGGNPGRSGHQMAVAAARIVEGAREAVADLFHVSDPSRVVFTSNATYALNVALYGVLRPGDHVVTTSLEHNSVMRPLRHLEKTGVELTVVPCSADGELDLDKVRGAFRRETRLLVTTHGSNVLGTLMPIESLAAAARSAGVLYLVDAAQTAGAVPIDVEALGADLMAVSGHKGLLGPTGTGVLYIREGVPLAPLVRGGTGSDSASHDQPDFLPDVYESGTLNVAGIAGLGAAVRFLSDVGIEVVRAHEGRLVDRFLAGASEVAGVEVYGPRDPAIVCGVVSFNVAGATPSEVGLMLDESYGIMARTGLHCAPSAHRTAGTFPDGTVRFSFGWFNTAAEVDRSLAALGEISRWAARAGRGLENVVATEHGRAD
jgi:cysteine desulfurase family protein